MKLNFTFLILILLLTTRTFGQATDSTTTRKTFNSFNTSFKGTNSNSGSIMDSRKQKQLIIKDNVTIETYNLQLTFIEAEIADMEASECKALLKRDTAALKNIWQRDFTLDEPKNEIHDGKNPLPYYVSLNRTIEKFAILDNVVYTTGQEYVQRLRSDGKISDPIKKDFSHIWIKKFGTWKLSTKN